MTNVKFFQYPLIHDKFKSKFFQKILFSFRPMILDTIRAERTPTIILISSNPTPLINRPPDAIRFRAWNLSRPFRVFLVAYTFVHACRFNHRRVLCACCTYVSTTLLFSLSSSSLLSPPSFPLSNPFFTVYFFLA